MLTVLRYCNLNLKDIHYSIMVEWCIANSKHYMANEDFKRAAHWSKQSAKYLLKRLDVLHKRGLL